MNGNWFRLIAQDGPTGTVMNIQDWEPYREQDYSFLPVIVLTQEELNQELDAAYQDGYAKGFAKGNEVGY